MATEKPNSEMGDELRSSYITTFEDNETGWDRLKRIYSIDDNWDYSTDLKMIIRGITSCFMGGFMIGGLLAKDLARQEFKRKNQETIYVHKFQAKRGINDYMIMEMLKHGIKWGTKVSVLSGALLISCSALAAYHKKYRIRDLTLCSGVIGGIWRWQLGPKGMASGAIVGTALGAGFGSVLAGFMLATGTTYDDLQDHNEEFWRKKIRVEELRAKALRDTLNLKLEEPPLVEVQGKEWEEENTTI